MGAATSLTRGAARSRTSGENFVDLFMAQSSQRFEPPRNPGRFIAAVALQHGINTNIVHRWIREHSQATLVIQPQAFVPVTLSIEPEPVATKPVAVAATAEIRMELRRGTSSLTVMWPSELAGDCGAWLREWLR